MEGRIGEEEGGLKEGVQELQETEYRIQESEFRIAGVSLLLLKLGAGKLAELGTPNPEP
jgi:hypothetical protein